MWGWVGIIYFGILVGFAGTVLLYALLGKFGEQQKIIGLMVAGTIVSVILVVTALGGP